mmetsp:Transcript_15195/g.26981  ORF Transcript_15195/g.26981 Transcript_15195/m.26981 type:complete len:249 (+) Transcript_15195:455-1201(+)
MSLTSTTSNSSLIFEKNSLFDAAVSSILRFNRSSSSSSSSLVWSFPLSLVTISASFRISSSSSLVSAFLSSSFPAFEFSLHSMPLFHLPPPSFLFTPSFFLFPTIPLPSFRGLSKYVSTPFLRVPPFSPVSSISLFLILLALLPCMFSFPSLFPFLSFLFPVSPFSLPLSFLLLLPTSPRLFPPFPPSPLLSPFPLPPLKPFIAASPRSHTFSMSSGAVSDSRLVSPITDPVTEWNACATPQVISSGS